jgi:DNA polymerase-3 subunit beta
MKFEVSKTILLKALSDVNGAVEKKNTIPVLQNIKIEAKDNKVFLFATDMDILITTNFDCQISTEGSTTVLAQNFFDIIRKIPDGIINIDLENENLLQIKLGKSRYKLPCIESAEFPIISSEELSDEIELDAKIFAKMISKTQFAISNDETRYYLNGLFLHSLQENENHYIRTVATDGHRLAMSSLFTGIAKDFGVIVPKKTVSEIKRIIETAKTVSLAVSRVKIKVVCDKTTIISKLIDGEFPPYDKVLPKNNFNIVNIKRKDLFDCLDRISILANDKHRSVKIKIFENKFCLQIGDDANPLAYEELEIVYSENKIESGFNSKYLLDIISQIEKEEVVIKFNDGFSPALIESTDSNSLFVIMPVRI